MSVLKDSLSIRDEAPSNMRLLVTICVITAVCIAFGTFCIWVLAFVLDKEVKELGLMLGLCGTFLAPLAAKAAQAFAENK